LPAEANLVAVIEGHFASELLLGLLRAGTLKLLERPWRIDDLSLACGIETAALKRCLDYLTDATTVIVRLKNGRYRLGECGFAELAFQLEKFIGAYGGSIRGLGAAHEAKGIDHRTDQEALATAFSYTAGTGTPIAQHLHRAGVGKMLELGCGSEPLAIQMALLDDRFEGLCIDSSAPMCRLAARRIRSTGLRSRVRVERARVQDIRSVVSAPERRSYDALFGRSILNTLFGGCSSEAVSFLVGLRSAFPNCRAFFIDYYSELHAKRPKLPARRVARLQDLVQMASGQGLPPSNRGAWAALYNDAGCRLAAARDFNDRDIRWFIHEVHL
jgi:hypothetical protein